jgi:hypothetical protein
MEIDRGQLSPFTSVSADTLKIIEDPYRGDLDLAGVGNISQVIKFGHTGVVIKRFIDRSWDI